MKLSVKLDAKGIAAFTSGSVGRALAAALRKAGSTALRDMRSEASKRIRARKALKAGIIAKALTVQRPSGGAAALLAGEWALRVTGKPVPLIAYPHRLTRGADGAESRPRMGFGRIGEARIGTVQQTLSVEVNRGKWTMLPGAFLARMKSGHEGIFRRVGKARLPIHELFGSRPVDALLHAGEAEAVQDRGQKSFASTFERLLPLELAKGGK